MYKVFYHSTYQNVKKKFVQLQNFCNIGKKDGKQGKPLFILPKKHESDKAARQIQMLFQGIMAL